MAYQPIQNPMPVSDNSTTLSVDDGAGSLTVDGTVSVSGTTTISGTVTANAGTGTFTVGDGGSTISVDDGAGSLTVDGTVAATQSGTWSVRTQDGSGNALASGTAAPTGTERGLITRNIPSGTQTVSGTVTANAGTGTFTVGDGGGSLTVDGTVAATQSGTWNVGSVTSITNAVTVSQATASSLNAQVVGAAAHDAIVSGNPVLQGLEARTTNPTAVADGDAVRAMADDVGRQVTRPHQTRDLTTHATTTLTTTTETTILTAGGVGVYHDLLGLIITNTSPTSVRVDFRDATAGTVRLSLYATAGHNVGFMPPIPINQSAANGNWTATLSTAVTDVRIFVLATKEV